MDAPEIQDEPAINSGQVFKTMNDVEDAIKYLQDKHHHPLKVYKSESVESYNKKVF